MSREVTRNLRKPLEGVLCHRLLVFMRDDAEVCEGHFGALASVGAQAPQPCPEWLREAGARAERYLARIRSAGGVEGAPGGADPGAKFDRIEVNDG